MPLNLLFSMLSKVYFSAMCRDCDEKGNLLSVSNPE